MKSLYAFETMCMHINSFNELKNRITEILNNNFTQFKITNWKESDIYIELRGNTDMLFSVCYITITIYKSNISINCILVSSENLLNMNEINTRTFNTFESTFIYLDNQILNKLIGN